MSTDLDAATAMLAASSQTSNVGAAAIYLAEARMMIAREKARIDELSLLLDAREREMAARAAGGQVKP